MPKYLQLPNNLILLISRAEGQPKANKKVIKMNISELAKSLNVKDSDLLSLVRMVASSLEKDSMKDIFLSMSEEERINTTQAYIAAEVKKFTEFCQSILTNTEKKNAFDQYMLYKLNG